MATSFQEYADSVRAKAHLGGVRPPVLVGVTAAALVAALAAAAALAGACASDGFSVQKAESAAVADGAAGAEREDAAAQAVIAVHVGGAVASPGVYELAEGARVQDAVAAAGGLAEGAASDALNLARTLADGEQVIVPSQADVEVAASAAAEGTAAAGTGTAAAGGKVNINAATAAELDALPGIGPSTAEKIIADREANGPFASTEDLKRVSGIGDKKYAQLADAICVG